MTGREALVSYVFATDSDEEASRLEDAMFADARLGAELTALLALRRDIRALHAHEGSLGLTMTRAALRALEASGKRVQAVELSELGSTPGGLEAGVEILAAVLPLDLSDVRRIEVSLHDPDGTPRDVSSHEAAFDVADGAVIVPCDVRIALRSEATLFRVVAHRASGVTRHDYVATLP